MGIFRTIGRQVEQFKQNAKAAAEEDLAYRCEECGDRFEGPRDRCPNCGSSSIVEVSTPG
jgi:uncharacterized OB-fold protein